MAFCAAIATAVIIGACGSSIPGDAVAQIGAASITTAALDHWLTVANDANQVSTGATSTPVGTPPDFTACVAAQRKLPGSTTTSASALKALCAQNYQSVLTAVMNFLIQAVWIEGEAVDRGVRVTDAQVEQSYQAQRKVAVPALKTTAELNNFLAKSGETVTDLKWRTRLTLIRNAILSQVQKAASHVSSAQITAYYHKNLALFTTPETRNLHLVETTTQARAAKVKALLASGSSYASLAAKYSIDPTTKSAGGKMLGVRTSELNAQLSAAVFAAKPGVLVGPVKTAFGYYVFTVDKVTPSVVQSLAGAKASIKTLLVQQQQSKASTALANEFSKKWLARTTCRSSYAVGSFCPNAPKASTGSTASTGASGATG